MFSNWEKAIVACFLGCLAAQAMWFPAEAGATPFPACFAVVAIWFQRDAEAQIVGPVILVIHCLARIFRDAMQRSIYFQFYSILFQHQENSPALLHDLLSNALASAE
jgi:hypothetical protein